MDDRLYILMVFDAMTIAGMTHPSSCYATIDDVARCTPGNGFARVYDRASGQMLGYRGNDGDSGLFLATAMETAMA